MESHGNDLSEDAVWNCKKCGKGNQCDVCHEHDEPRDCNECPPGDDDNPAFPCAGYEGCLALVFAEDDVCQPCQDRNDSENAGGCPGCGGNCVTACR